MDELKFKQKIYIVDIDTNSIVHITRTNVLPRLDETLTILDRKTGKYRHYRVIQCTHGFNVDDASLQPSKQVASPIVSTVHVRFIKEEAQK